MVLAQLSEPRSLEPPSSVLVPPSLLLAQPVSEQAWQQVWVQESPPAPVPVVVPAQAHMPRTPHSPQSCCPCILCQWAQASSLGHHGRIGTTSPRTASRK